MLVKALGLAALSTISVVLAENTDSIVNGASEIANDTTDEFQESAAELQCSIYAGANIWNIRPLEADNQYEYTDSQGNTYEWNYCTYLTEQVDHVQSYATLTTSNGKETALATQYISDDDKQFVLRDDSDAVTGLQFSQYSSSVCIAGKAATNTTEATEDTPYSFTTKLMCDQEITGQGAGKILDLTVAGCDTTVTMAHEAGCPVISGDKAVSYLETNPWIMGTIFLAVGLVVGLFGQKLFPWVAASVVALFTMTCLGSLFLAFGLMDGMVGAIIFTVLSVGLGIGAGSLVRRNIQLMMLILDIVTGFFGGAVVFGIVVLATAWQAYWGFWLFCILGALFAFFLSIKLGWLGAALKCSLIGAYFFMRAFTLYFPGYYVTESDLVEKDAEDLHFTWQYFCFLAVLVGSFFAFFNFQVKMTDKDADLDEYERA